MEFNILANVECQFNIGEFSSHITTNLGIECKTCQSFLKGVDGKYHHIPILDLKKSFLQLCLCKEVVLIGGIRTIQVAF
jgi:hypothetical protein